MTVRYSVHWSKSHAPPGAVLGEEGIGGCRDRARVECRPFLRDAAGTIDAGRRIDRMHGEPRERVVVDDAHERRRQRHEQVVTIDLGVSPAEPRIERALDALATRKRPFAVTRDVVATAWSRRRSRWWLSEAPCELSARRGSLRRARCARLPHPIERGERRHRRRQRIQRQGQVAAARRLLAEPDSRVARPAHRRDGSDVHSGSTTSTAREFGKTTLGCMVG